MCVCVLWVLGPETLGSEMLSFDLSYTSGAKICDLINQSPSQALINLAKP